MLLRKKSSLSAGGNSSLRWHFGVFEVRELRQAGARAARLHQGRDSTIVAKNSSKLIEMGIVVESPKYCRRKLWQMSILVTSFDFFYLPTVLGSNLDSFFPPLFPPPLSKILLLTKMQPTAFSPHLKILQRTNKVS